MSHTVHLNLVSLVLNFTLIDMASLSINSILSFLKLKLMILYRIDTHLRKMYYKSIFQQ